MKRPPPLLGNWRPGTMRVEVGPTSLPLVVRPEDFRDEDPRPARPPPPALWTRVARAALRLPTEREAERMAKAAVRLGLVEEGEEPAGAPPGDEEPPGEAFLEEALATAADLEKRLAALAERVDEAPLAEIAAVTRDVMALGERLGERLGPPPEPDPRTRLHAMAFFEGPRIRVPPIDLGDDLSHLEGLVCHYRAEDAVQIAPGLVYLPDRSGNGHHQVVGGSIVEDPRLGGQAVALDGKPPGDDEA